MTTAVDSQPLDEIDLSDWELFRDGVPHHVFRRLRSEAPVWRHPSTPGVNALIGDQTLWVVSTHAEVQAVSRDADTFSAEDGPSIPLQRPSPTGDTWAGRSLVSSDGAAHSRLRNLINRGFTPRMVTRLEERIVARSSRIVDDILSHGEFNFVSDVAKELPMQLFADMLGVPDDERPHLFHLLESAFAAGDPNSDITPEQHASFHAQLFQYGHDISKARRDSPQDDLWTKVACAEVKDSDGRATSLSDWELQLFFFVLLAAGSETTQNAIAEGILTFLDHPSELHRFREDPSARDTAAQEMIRWTSPLRYWARTATRDTELGGESIRSGDRISVWFGSANRDERVFEHPDRFDITRSPNPHCAFGGGGQHYCLGSHLAAREIRVIFETLFDRIREVELVGTPRWAVPGLANNISCSLADIPVRVHAK